MPPEKRSGCGIPIWFLLVCTLAGAAFFFEWARYLFVLAFFAVLLVWVHREPPDAPPWQQGEDGDIRLSRGGWRASEDEDDDPPELPR